MISSKVPIMELPVLTMEKGTAEKEKLLLYFELCGVSGTMLSASHLSLSHYLI